METEESNFMFNVKAQKKTVFKVSIFREKAVTDHFQLSL